MAEVGRSLALGEGTRRDLEATQPGQEEPTRAAGRSVGTTRDPSRPGGTYEDETASEYSLRSRLAELTLPVRFLVGIESPPYLWAATEAAHAAIPHSDGLEIAGQAHMATDGVRPSPTW